MRTCKTRTCKTRTSKTRICKTRTCKTRTSEFLNRFKGKKRSPNFSAIANLNMPKKISAEKVQSHLKFSKI